MRLQSVSHMHIESLLCTRRSQLWYFLDPKCSDGARGDEGWDLKAEDRRSKSFSI
jgi:hypothetical protein